MEWVSAGCITCASTALALAAIHDLAVRTVPNSLIGLLTSFALLLSALEHRLLPSFLVASLLLFLGTILWLRGYCGGADAKLIAATGLLLAPNQVMTMLQATAIAGGALCIPYLPGCRFFSRPASERPRQMVRRVLRCELWRLRRRGPLPYAVAIAVGTLFALHGG